jgi:hypothetical protein
MEANVVFCRVKKSNDACSSVAGDVVVSAAVFLTPTTMFLLLLRMMKTKKQLRFLLVPRSARASRIVVAH